MRDLIQSPLNYTGGKFRLLPQILPLFPKKIRVFTDLFCGGGNVGINMPADHVIYNELSSEVAGLLRLFREKPENEIVEGIVSLIHKYGLSRSREYGYEYYGCKSSSGLGDYNRKGFLALRSEYNRRKSDDPVYASLMLYALIVYSFNNQIRFNSLGEYNLPVGKRDFNKKMETKLRSFIAAIQAQDCEITNADFRNFDVGVLNEYDLVYVDPPYLITCATYNENGGWDEACERDLLAFLDELNERHVNFALSNVLTSKGNTNTILRDWLANRNYSFHHFAGTYSNSNYHRLDKSGASDEILVTNYGSDI